MINPSVKAFYPPIYPFDSYFLQNFSEFVYYNGLMQPVDINRINQLWDKEKSEKAAVNSEEQYNEELRKSSVIALEPEEQTQWIFDKLGLACLQCNKERYHFDLRGFFEPLQLAEYGVGDFFDWHLDFGTAFSSSRKLSISVQLSPENSYEGGDLEFMINQKTVSAPRKQGTVIIFPSFIMHRVTPITKGTRRSIVGWIGGAPFR